MSGYFLPPFWDFLDFGLFFTPFFLLLVLDFVAVFFFFFFLFVEFLPFFEFDLPLEVGFDFDLDFADVFFLLCLDFLLLPAPVSE